MRYLSVCSGIEAASVAWHPLGWDAVAFSEIEKFPCAVLAHHYPEVPNWGDMTKYQEWPDADIDLLVGGTPCQSFSVAGLRKGLDDPRGNLMLTFGAIAKRYRPDWLVWENVPGVLSSSGGKDFGTFLGMLAELGYGFAYRVLDAQYVRVESHARAVPQRRRRVFVVGCLGDWRRAAAVLFERESLRGDSAPRREAGKTAPTIPSRSTAGGGLGTDFDCDGGLVRSFTPSVHGDYSEGLGTLRAADGDCGNGSEVLVALPDVSPALKARDYKGPSSDGDGAPLLPCTAHSLRADGFDASEDGTGRGTPIVAVQERAICENPEAGPDGVGVRTDGASYTLEARGVPQAVAFSCKDSGQDAGGEIAPTLRGLSEVEGNANGGMTVRRLTPRECERLQGFPDDYTLIHYRGKPAADGPRYKALGNAMAVNVMSWIGQRIQLVSEIKDNQAVA